VPYFFQRIVITGDACIVVAANGLPVERGYYSLQSRALGLPNECVLLPELAFNRRDAIDAQEFLRSNGKILTINKEHPFSQAPGRYISENG
jgi:hypothetical protein